MIPRSTVLAALVMGEAAIVGAGVLAIRGGFPDRWQGHVAEAATIPGSLVAGGAHRTFGVEQHPTVTIDIDNADLTILTSDNPQVDIALAKSDLGIMQSSVPIVATRSGDTIRLAKSEDDSMSDDRMLTVVVPPDTAIDVVSAGDIHASGLRSQATFDSPHGDVSISNYDAPALHVDAGRGHVSLSQVAAASLDVQASDDSVDGTALAVHDGRVESDGQVTLAFAPGVDTTVTAATSDGKIGLAGDVSDASAVPSHDEDSDSDAQSRTVRLGAGTGHFDVHAHDGNIDLSE